MINEKMLDSLSKLLIYQRLDDYQKLHWGTQLCLTQGDVLSDNVDQKYGGLISSGYNSSTPTTNLLKTWDVPDKNIFVCASYIKGENAHEPTYGISLDSGTTWKEGIPLNTISDTKGLKSDTDGKYRLKIRFHIYQDINANTWTTKNNAFNTIGYQSYITLTSDIGVSCNGSTSYNPWNSVITAFRYIASTDVWSSRCDDLIARSESFAINLTTNYGIVQGGHPTSSSYTNIASCYIDSNNVIISKSSGGTTSNSGGFSLTSDYGLIVGGNISGGGGITNLVNGFTFSSNIWASRTGKTTTMDGCGGLSFTSDIGVSHGGNTGGLAVSTVVERYTYSSNSWASRTSYPFGIDDAQELNFTTDIGLVVGGRTGTTEPYATTNLSNLYSLSANTWTSMASCSMARWEMGGFSFSSNCGLIYGGINNSITQNRVEKYTYGKSSLLGFSILTW